MLTRLGRIIVILVSAMALFAITTPAMAQGPPLVPGDFDGDGDTDAAVFRPSTGRWYIRGITNFPYGASGDIPVPGDYDGDGDTDAAVFRPSTGRWYIRGITNFPYGASGDIPLEKRPTYPGYPY